jgi:hypothetical protein
VDTAAKLTDSIPRAALAQIIQILGYLAATEESSTFEQVRLFLLKRSSRAAPSSKVAMWTVARDVLIELQKLGFVEAGVLPRTQSLAERHANTPCRLTEAGRALADVCKESQGRALDQLLVAWVNQHPYFRACIARLHNGPLYIPDVTSAKQIGADAGSNQFADRIASGCLNRMGTAAFPSPKAEAFRRAVSDRLGNLGAEVKLSELDTKKLVDTVQDKVVLPAVLTAEELNIDAVSFQHLLKAAKDFFAASWTTSHPDFSVRVIYPTCEFQPALAEGIEVIKVAHHGKTFASDRFVEALRAAYVRAPKAAGAYADAYAVRALVCIDLQIQPKVFAACLRDLIVAGPTPEIAIYTELPFDPPPPGEEYLVIDRDRIGLIKLAPS